MQRTKLRLETLEAREMPALFGTPWPGADHLTVSFASDGTNIAGFGQGQWGQMQPSVLGTELNSVGSTATWKTEILRAFQTWAVQSNINIGLVPDSGAAFGPESLSPGTLQGGDFRVGALTLSTDVVAISQPYNPLTGSWSGDILVNAAKNFSLSGSTGTFDLFTTFLHESANALGLPDTNDPTSARFGNYMGKRTGLNATDIAAIQGLYGGIRKADVFDTLGSNQSESTATKLLTLPLPTDLSKYAIAIKGDLTTATDVDWYEIKTRTGTSTLQVRLETVGKSLLAGKVSIYTTSGTLLGTASGSGILQIQDLLVVAGVSSNTSYRIKVEKARSDVFGIGNYELKIGENFDPLSVGIVASTVQVIGNDGNTDNTLATARTLTPFLEDWKLVYHAYAHLDAVTDKDYYRLTAPITASNAMTVVVQPSKSYSVFPKITVLNASGQVVPSEVVVNGDGGRYVVQVANPIPGGSYRVLVEAVGQNGNYLQGEYDLRVDFSTPAVQRSTVAQGTLTNTQKQDHITFVVPESRVYSFALDATSSNPSVVSGLRLVIFNAAGQIVATFTTEAGKTTTATILLTSGTYFFRFEAATKTGVTLPNLTYRLRAVVVSDPIDPYEPEDPTDPPPPPPDYETQDQGDPYYTNLHLLDPYENIWTP